MIQKTRTELEKAKILKAVRSAIRLKHALGADEELNEVLPRVEAEVDRAIAEGKLLELNPADYIRDV